MNTPLTPKQQAVLDAIRQFVETYQAAPTLRQLMEALNYGQLSSVQRHVEALREKGLLTPGEGRHGVRMRENAAGMAQLPLAGTVECGALSLAEEHIEAYVSYPRSKLRNPYAKYFFVKAHGDSMNRSDLQIKEGDYLLVQQTPSARTGDIIIALVGDDATCKVLGKTDDGLPMLVPRSDNPIHKPRILFDDFSVMGIVESAVRPHGSAHD